MSAIRSAKRWNRFYTWTTMMFLGASVATCVYFIAKALPDPARVLMDPKPHGEVRPGGDLLIDLVVHMNKKCDAIVTWWILDSAENTVIVSDVQPALQVPIGETSLTIKRTLPETIKPGRYVYKSMVLDTCGDSRIYISGTRVPFTVR